MDFSKEKEEVEKKNYKLSEIRKSKEVLAQRLMEYYRNNFGI